MSDTSAEQQRGGATISSAPQNRWAGPFWASVLMGLFLFAYRSLLFYDPQATDLEAARGAESLLFEPTGSSPVITLAVVAWISFSRISQLCQEAPGRIPWPASFFLLAPGVGLYLWANFVSAPDILIASLAWILAGSGLLLGGGRGLRLLLLPACFLVFAIPLPIVLVNHWIWPLQLLTGEIAVEILSYAGMNPILHGDIIHTTERTFQVIESCSGLRTIETLTMASVLYAHLFFRSRLQAVLLVIAAPLIGFAVNVARVMTIILNPYSEVGSIHTIQGIVMLVIGVLLVAGFDKILSLLLPAQSLTQRKVTPAIASGTLSYPGTRILCVGILLAGMGLTTLSVKPWKPGPREGAMLFRMPAKMSDGWKIDSGLPLDKEFLGSARFSEWVNRKYSHADEKEGVEILLVSDNRLDRSTHILSPKISVPGPGWILEKSRRVQLEPGSPTVTSQIYGSHGRRMLVYQWYENMEDLPTEFLRHVLGLDRSPWRRSPGRSLAIRVSTPLSPGLLGEKEAELRLRRFARATQQELVKVGIQPNA